MPKVRGLTREQREQQADEAELSRISSAYLEMLGAEMGRRDMERQELADYIGIGDATLWRWKKGGLCKASFETLIKAARRLGFRLVLVPLDPKRAPLWFGAQ